MFVKGLKAGEADSVEKDWQSGPVPTGEPGLISCSASSEQNLWESQLLSPRCQHFKDEEGHTCITLQRLHLSVACPPIPTFLSKMWDP